MTTDDRTLRCLFCGAPHPELATTCMHCKSELGRVVCPKCKTWNAAGETSCRCGEALGVGPREDLVCPRCAGALKSVELDAGALGARQCVKCGGCFLGIHDWTGILDHVARGDAFPLDRFSKPTQDLPQAALVANVKCPECKTLMDRVNFDARSGATIDICNVHGIWLDAGELDTILSFVKAREEHHGVVPFTKEEIAAELAFQQQRDTLAREDILRDQVVAGKRSARNWFLASIVIRFFV